IQNGSSRLLISQGFLPKSDTTGRLRGTLRNKCFSRASDTILAGPSVEEIGSGEPRPAVSRVRAEKRIGGALPPSPPPQKRPHRFNPDSNSRPIRSGLSNEAN